MDQQLKNDTCLLVLSTFPDLETARQIGTALVDRQLAACANVLPGIESIYRWEGKVETGNEVMALIKTVAFNIEPLKAAITEMHPYEVPEIIAVEISGGSGAYLKWLAGSCLPST